MIDYKNMPHEYDNYPVPDKIVPVTDANREEYLAVKQKTLEVAAKIRERRKGENQSGER